MTFCIAAVAQLSKAIESESKLVIAEGIAYAKPLLCGHSNFELVLCSGICYDLPVVLAVHKWSIRNHSSE